MSFLKSVSFLQLVSFLNPVVKAVVLYLVLGVLSGIVWLVLANPAKWTESKTGKFMDEQASQGRFGVIAVFVIIGVLVSLVWGWFAGRSLNGYGWLLVPLFAFAAIVSAAVAWRIGVLFGPPDPATVQADVGQKVPQQLALDSVAPFLVWPIFALGGLFFATYTSGGGAHIDDAEALHKS